MQHRQDYARQCREPPTLNDQRSNEDDKVMTNVQWPNVQRKQERSTNAARDRETLNATLHVRGIGKR